MKDRVGLLLAIATVFIANAAALAHVWSNRASSEPEIVLTERELPKAYQQQDNTGVSFNLQRVFDAPETWLDRKELQELGFDCSVAPDNDAGRRHYSRMLPRPAFVALEFDGPAWERYLVDLRGRRTEPQVEQVRRSNSRLVAIDAASDAVALRRRYPDATKVLIVSAKIGPNPYAEGTPSTPKLTGRIEILEREINVPLPINTQVNQITGGPNVFQGEPRYQVRLRFGSRREPWVTGVDRLR